MTPKASDETKIALIQKDIANIQSDMAEVKQYIKENNQTLATKDNLAVVAKETEVRLVRLESASNLWKWLSPSISAVLGSILTFLIVNYLQKLQ